MNPLNQFINNLSKKPTSTPNMSVAPKSANMSMVPSALSPSAASYASFLTANKPKPVVTGNQSATAPVVKKTTTPQVTQPAPKLSPIGQQYAQNLGQNTGLSTIPGPYDPATGQLKQTSPQAPQTPTAPIPEAPKAPSATDTAFAEYIKFLTPSKDVTSAKTAYNDYVANQSKSISGLEGRDAGVPLSIVRGQQEKLLNQTQPEALRLQNAIGIAQDEQTGLQNVSKAMLDYQVGREKSATDAENLAYEREQAQYDRMTNEQKTAFDQEYKNKQLQQDDDKLTQDKLESDRTFEENKRQFGLEYAQKAQEIGIAQQKANQDGAAATGTSSSVENSLSQLSFLSDTAKKALDLSGASGASGINKFFGDKFVGDTKFRQLESLTNTLRTNVLTLMTDPSIKKFFGPQMSEADVRLMTAAGTTLNPENQSPELLKTEVTRLQNLFGRMEASLKGANISQTTDPLGIR